jgi:hypothetical protein
LIPPSGKLGEDGRPQGKAAMTVQKPELGLDCRYILSQDISSIDSADRCKLSADSFLSCAARKAERVKWQCPV